MTQFSHAKSTTLLNTAMDSSNDGDQIIVDSIFREFPQLKHLPEVPTHRAPTSTELALARSSKVLIVTGTNILTGVAGSDRQWPLTEREVDAYAGKVVFLGVGWRDYETTIAPDRAALIRRLRHPDIPVAARDGYTHERLISLSVASANTGCPTMWSLPDRLSTPGSRDECVFTLTDYRPDRVRDHILIRALSHTYRHVHLWPQSEKDSIRAQSLRLPRNVHTSPRGLGALETSLEGRDYVGTRLHAGVRAMQLGSPALVAAVDNRAIEIGRDTNLPVVARSKGTRAILRILRSAEKTTDLTLPKAEIKAWKESLTALLEKP